MDLVINLSALFLIAAIIWWFWLYKPEAVTQQGEVVDILVDNGVYTPAHIKVKRGQPLHLRFTRKDPSPCAEKVLFDKMNLSVDLPVGEPVEIKIDTGQAGDFEFTCQMQMYRGSLIIE